MAPRESGSNLDDAVMTAGTMRAWIPLVVTAALGLVGFGITWDRANNRIDLLTARVAILEQERGKDREVMQQLLTRVEKMDRRLVLFLCSQDPKRCTQGE